MKYSVQKLSFLFALFLFSQSCSTDKAEDLRSYDLRADNSQGNEISIPDENFRNTLVNANCVDTDADGIPDTDADLNNDGVIQKKEANSIESLILHFDYGTPVKFVDLSGIEGFMNLKFLKISGTGGSLYYDEALNTENLNYDFSDLRKLEYLQINHLASEYFDSINLSGLTKLKKIDLSGNRPMNYYSEKNHFITVNLEGCSNLTDLNMTNSFLNIDFCQAPSLEVLNMFYLEGGEPDIFDFHCLTNLKWLNIGENMISTLILKNTSVLETFLTDGIGSSGVDPIYPYPQNICIDNLQEEMVQISPLVGENTMLTTDCSF